MGDQRKIKCTALRTLLRSQSVTDKLKRLGVQACDAQALFRFLDVDGDHIDVNEFVVGVMRMRADSHHKLDMASLLLERRLYKSLSAVHSDLRQLKECLE